jgi:hypothetical protein
MASLKKIRAAIQRNKRQQERKCRNREAKWREKERLEKRKLLVKQAIDALGISRFKFKGENNDIHR